MKPLLWKEFREVRFQFVLWALVFWICALTRKIPSFGPAYITAAGLLIPLGAALAAIAMGVSNLIQERRSRTLDFLLTRPASASQIIWAKFLAGSTVVLYIVGLFAVFIYLESGDASWDSYLSQAVKEAGLPKLLAVLLPPFWFLYALTLLISVLVDESAKAFVTAGAIFTCRWCGSIA
jgi:ABC-type transport system involved in multi-copper enzyme maturation permease subunit